MVNFKTLGKNIKSLPGGYFAVTVILFVSMLFVAIWLVAAPKQEFSENENRVLEPFPALSLENVRSGEFMKSFELYVGDHFPVREKLVSANTLLQLAFGKRDLGGSYGKDVEGGVYFGKNSHLYEVLLPGENDTFRRNVEALGRFAKEVRLPVTFLPVPSGAQEQPENLPDYAPEYDQKLSIQYICEKMGGSAKVVDAFQTLSLKGGCDYYFKTDHHWTAEGAYAGYQAIAFAMGIHIVPQSSFTLTEASEPFYGTLYSKALFSLQEPDVFRYPEFPADKNVTQQTGSTIHYGIYYKEYLNAKDKYSFYLGGNPGETILRNPAAKSGKLMVLKDSFANSMMPYLMRNFSEIHLIDLRYYNKEISQYAKQNAIDRVVMIYSIKELSDVPIYNKLP